MNDHNQDPQETNTAAPEATPQEPGAAPVQADALQKERDDLYDRLLRKSAEFDNFRKRVERDRKDMIEWAAADVLTDLLQIADDFDRALAAEAPPEAKVYKAGLELIQRQLAELL
jgi:molecular chaperone GrpE